MAVDQQHRRAPARRRTRPTYFVGRRHGEAAEVYAVGPKDVTRLRSTGRYGEMALDWHGSSAARMELGHLLISRIADQRPSRELQARFALYVLSHLPNDGFVLESAQIRRWLLAAADDEQDFLPAERAPWSWVRRLRSLLPDVPNGRPHG